MFLKSGLYLFHESKGFSVCSVYLGGFTELGMGSAGELLIDFLDYDFSKISSIIQNIDTISGEEIFDIIDEIGTNAAVPFLIKIMTDRHWTKAFDMSPQNWGDRFKAAVSPILDSIISTHNSVWEFADYYCEYYGSVEERFDFFHSLEEQFTTMAVEEIISARKPGRDFFLAPSESDYCFPYTRAYRFTDMQNYVQFLFLNMMQSNSNFCKCNYCYNFFIPKTKKLTRFCDRINPESGKTCKEIAPTIYRNEDIGSNKVLKEYNLALRRNYKRMCRGEERLPGTSSDKDIDPKTYFDWRDRALKAMKLWKGKEISDAEFLNIVKELD